MSYKVGKEDPRDHRFCLILPIGCFGDSTLYWPKATYALGSLGVFSNFGRFKGLSASAAKWLAQRKVLKQPCNAGLLGRLSLGPWGANKDLEISLRNISTGSTTRLGSTVESVWIGRTWRTWIMFCWKNGLQLLLVTDRALSSIEPSTERVGEERSKALTYFWRSFPSTNRRAKGSTLKTSQRSPLLLQWQKLAAITIINVSAMNFPSTKRLLHDSCKHIVCALERQTAQTWPLWRTTWRRCAEKVFMCRTGKRSPPSVSSEANLRILMSHGFGSINHNVTIELEVSMSLNPAIHEGGVGTWGWAIRCFLPKRWLYIIHNTSTIYLLQHLYGTYNVYINRTCV